MKLFDNRAGAVSALVGAVAGLAGRWNALLSALAALMLMDYLSGVICAWRGCSPHTEHGGVSSRAGFTGLIRKGFILLVVLLATLLDDTMGNDSGVFQTATALYYLANEGISVLENCAAMGVPFPEFIKKALETLRDRGDGGEA